MHSYITLSAGSLVVTKWVSAVSIWISMSSLPGKIGAHDRASAILWVFPGTYVTLNWCPETFSRSRCSLGLVRSEIPLLKVPTKGLWSVATVKSGSPF